MKKTKPRPRMNAYKPCPVSPCQIVVIVLMMFSETGFAVVASGVMMCRSRCLHVEGCVSYTYSTAHLHCCLKGCHSYMDYIAFRIEKKELSLTKPSRCRKEYIKVITRRKQVVCLATGSYLKRRERLQRKEVFVPHEYRRMLFYDHMGQYGLSELHLKTMAVTKSTLDVQQRVMCTTYSSMPRILYVATADKHLLSFNLQNQKKQIIRKSASVIAMDVDQEDDSLFYVLKLLNKKYLVLKLAKPSISMKMFKSYARKILIAADWKKKNVYVRDRSRIFGITKNKRTFTVVKTKSTVKSCIALDSSERFLFFEDGQFIMRYNLHLKTIDAKRLQDSKFTILVNLQSIYIIHDRARIEEVDKNISVLLKSYKLKTKHSLLSGCLVD